MPAPPPVRRLVGTNADGHRGAPRTAGHARSSVCSPHHGRIARPSTSCARPTSPGTAVGSRAGPTFRRAATPRSEDLLQTEGPDDRTARVHGPEPPQPAHRIRPRPPGPFRRTSPCRSPRHAASPHAIAVAPAVVTRAKGIPFAPRTGGRAAKGPPADLHRPDPFADAGPRDGAHPPSPDREPRPGPPSHRNNGSDIKPAGDGQL